MKQEEVKGNPVQLPAGMASKREHVGTRKPFVQPRLERHAPVPIVSGSFTW